MKSFLLFALLIQAGLHASAGELLTNCAHFSNAPKWLSLNRVNRAAEPVENFMEWSTRRVEVEWFTDQAAFERAHGMGPAALAVTFRGQNKMILGPRVTEKNFEKIFGHELVHVISSQKYKDAIPTWLEEGVANYISKNGAVDYKSLVKVELGDIAGFSHPMMGDAAMIHTRYQASQALTEMIASKCDFRNLLRLSVERKMQDYLANICRISDINSAFKKWVQDKGKS
jgi:hypothetical protein